MIDHGLTSVYGFGIVNDTSVPIGGTLEKHRVWLGSFQPWIDFKRLQGVGLGEGWIASNEGAVG